MAKTKVYQVETAFVSRGVFHVQADSREEARRHVETSCGLVLGGDIHTTLPDDAAGWDFDTHPEMTFGKLTIKK